MACELTIEEGRRAEALRLAVQMHAGQVGTNTVLVNAVLATADRFEAHLKGPQPQSASANLLSLVKDQ